MSKHIVLLFLFSVLGLGLWAQAPVRAELQGEALTIWFDAQKVSEFRFVQTDPVMQQDFVLVSDKVAALGPEAQLQRAVSIGGLYRLEYLVVVPGSEAKWEHIDPMQLVEDAH